MTAGWPGRPMTRPPRWGMQEGWLARAVGRMRRALSAAPAPSRTVLPPLPLALRRQPLADRYLAAEGANEHRRAAAAAVDATERAMSVGEWWAADIWAHRALWHFERADDALHATRIARRIGDLRTLAGDPASARRYYAEAIGEARDIGAEREEGLAAFGLGRAMLDLGDVTAARRLAGIAVDLLERCRAPETEVAAARELRGEEKPVSVKERE
jgi:tetratricopeptide (TPR) repeat protein